MKIIHFFVGLCLFLIVLPSVFAADIGYIVKNPSYPDSSIISSIDNLGYTYELVDDADMFSTDFSKYKIILIGNENIRNAPLEGYRYLVINPYYYAGWSDSIGSLATSQALSAYNIQVNTPITLGVPQIFKAYTTGGSIPINYLVGKKYTCQAVTLTGDKASDLGDYVIATKQSPRRVFFGITETDYWTSYTQKLFENSLRWLINGEDKDGDGFSADVDCNDNDASVNPGAVEICDGKDNDCDGVIDENNGNCAAGNTCIAGVCIPQCVDNDGDGYDNCNPGALTDDGKAIDCNDNNILVHPNATEIPYDGIDQNCNGFDLGDVDGDGYCKEGYVIQSITSQCYKEKGNVGTDCNDNDIAIHPGAGSDKDCINDAPIIISFTPNRNPVGILKGKSQSFVVEGRDSDSVFNTFWYLDDVKVGENSTYLFTTSANDANKNYNLKVVLTDGEKEASHLWNVSVKSINLFTCEEIGGDICTDAEICSSGEFLGVSNSNKCCSVTCSEKPPQFSEIDDRKNNTGNVALLIETPESGGSYYLGDNLKIKIKVTNNINENLDLDVEAYLYDLTNDEIVKSSIESVSVNKNTESSIELNITAPGDLSENNSYAVFARIIGDNQYNENYKKIIFNRKLHLAVIDKVTIEQTGISCGDFVDVDIRVKNYGNSNEQVVLRIENADLKIDEETDEFKLEKYNEKDNIDKIIKIKIPGEIDKGEYVLKIEMDYNGVTVSRDKSIILGECISQIQTQSVETINLENKESQVISDKVADEKTNSYAWLLLIFPIGLTIIFGILFNAMKRK